MPVKTAVLLLVWLALVGAGLLAAVWHDTRPGESATPPVRVRTPDVRVGARGRLLVFVHPKCPCTRATVAELEQLLSETGRALDSTAYCYTPLDQRWDGAAICRELRAVPQLKVEMDRGGIQARRYGAETSGQVLLYSAVTGRLLFEGGLTSARGLEGPSAGSAAIATFAETGRCPVASAPVFGCSLLGLQEKEWTRN